MTAAEVLAAARAAGVTLWVEGDALRYRGPREALTAGLLDQLGVHKPAILAELDPDFRWTRVTITEPGGRVTEIESDCGQDLAEWQADTERRHGPGCSVTPIAGYPPFRLPSCLKKALANALEEIPSTVLLGLMVSDYIREDLAGNRPAIPGEFVVHNPPSPPPVSEARHPGGARAHRPPSTTPLPRLQSPPPEGPRHARP